MITNLLILEIFIIHSLLWILMVVPSIENTFLSFLGGDNLKVVYDVLVIIVLDALFSFSSGGS